MYKIIKGGAVVAMTDVPAFVRINPRNGCYNLCDWEQAEGVALTGSVYRIQGRPSSIQAEEVVLQPVDMGAELLAAQTTIADNDAMNVDQEYRLTLLELGLNEE